MKVQRYLEENAVEFEVIRHETAFTAQEVAASEHVTGHKFAKTVILKAGDDAYMFVLPASRHVNVKKAADAVGKELRLATEEEMKELFPDCQIGAEPPFGKLYGMPTYVDTTLQQVDEIVFRAGTHDTTVKMSYAAYEKLETPQHGSFALEGF